jgi:hypothetical protein
VAALAAAGIADRLPATQRFLRGPAVELVAALRTAGITADHARQVFERHADSAEAAWTEMNATLSGGKAPRPEGPFWASGI